MKAIWTRKLLAWGIAIVVVVALGFGYVGLSEAQTPNYGLIDGQIAFSPTENDITEDIVGATEMTTVAENGRFILSLTNRADIVITSKETGRAWSAVPQEADLSSQNAASMLIEYYTDESSNGSMTSVSAVEASQMRVDKLQNGVRVEYIFGEMDVEYIYPNVITEARINQFLEKLDESSRKFVLRRYTFYDYADRKQYLSEKEFSRLLSQYPQLTKDSNIYVLTEEMRDSIKSRLNGYFVEAGYTMEDKKADEKGEAKEKELPLTFRVAVTYALTEDGFTATMDSSQMAFYADYPLTFVSLLPNFDAYDQEESGWMLVPSGSGALVNVQPGKTEGSTTLPIYGYDLTTSNVSQKTEERCTLPVFGQVKNGAGWLCIIAEGEAHGSVCVNRQEQYSSIWTKFSIVDTVSYTLPARSPANLFAQGIDGGNMTLKYVLLPTADDNAYVDMATYYREYLQKNGGFQNEQLPQEPVLLTEIVHTINYDSLALGFIPSEKEFALTTFSQAEEIHQSILEADLSMSLQYLLTGWNEDGLTRQTPGTISVSEVAGAQKALQALQKQIASSGGKVYTEAAIGQVSVKNRIKDQMVVRGLNRDAISGTFSYGVNSLLSPNHFATVIKQYTGEQSLFSEGIGVSRFAVDLYSDLNVQKPIYRKQALDCVTEGLKELNDADIPILADGGNAYVLPYTDILNNVALSSAALNLFDCDVPFVGMVLHGQTAFVGTSTNQAADPDASLLQAIENGAGLHYTLTKNSFSELFETKYASLYNTRYDVTFADLKADAAQLSEALSGLARVKITDHKLISEDVRLVTYENGVRIAVNYSAQNVTVEGTTVKAKSWTRFQ